jgi:hypothetical protein
MTKMPANLLRWSAVTANAFSLPDGTSFDNGQLLMYLEASASYATHSEQPVSNEMERCSRFFAYGVTQGGAATRIDRKPLNCASNVGKVEIDSPRK